MTDCPLPQGSHVWGYCRDSGGETQERSIKSQEQGILEYVQRNGLVLDRVFADEAKTGSSISGRDQFEAMIGMTRREPQEADAIIVWSFSRFSRDQLDSAFFKADLRRRGWAIVSVTDDLPGNEFDRIFESLIEWKDQRFLKDLSEATKRGLRDLAVQGFSVGGFPPKGYLAEKVRIGTKRNGKPRYASRWVPDESAPRITEAFAMKAEGHSHREIIEATGVTQSVNTLADMLRNETYRGVRKSGDTRTEGAHEALVDKDTWERVQARLKLRGRKGKPWPSDEIHPRTRTSRYLLSGLVKCAKCGAAMVGGYDLLRGKTEWRFYRCNRRKRRGKTACDAGKVGAALIEEAIMSLVFDKLLTVPFLRELADKSASTIDRDMADLDHAIDTTKAEISKLTKAMAHLVDAVEQDGSEIARDRLREREAEVYSIRQRLRALEARRAERRVYLTDDVLEMALAELRHDLSTGDVAKKRALLRGFVEHIDVDRNEARVWYAFPLRSIDIPSVPGPKPRPPGKKPWSSP